MEHANTAWFRTSMVYTFPWRRLIFINFFKLNSLAWNDGNHSVHLDEWLVFSNANEGEVNAENLKFPTKFRDWENVEALHN